MVKPVGPQPLTPELSKAARRELSLTQNDVIKATGIQAYKLKMFESRSMSMPAVDARKVHDFYAEQLEQAGISFDGLKEHLGQSTANGAGSVPKEPPALKPGYTYTPRPGFFISEQLSAELVDQLMMKMEANDDRIGELISASFRAGFFGGMSDGTEASVRELFGALAENYMVFRFLQGRNIIAPTREEPATIGDYLSQWMRDESDVAPLLIPESDTADKALGKGVASPPASRPTQRQPRPAGEAAMAAGE